MFLSSDWKTPKSKSLVEITVKLILILITFQKCFKAKFDILFVT